MPTFPFRVRISPNVISQEVLLGETVLMDVKTLVYFGLDDLGSAVWQAIREFPQADVAFAHLVSVTAVPEEELVKKFEMIINGLRNNRLIQLEPD